MPCNHHVHINLFIENSDLGEMVYNIGGFAGCGLLIRRTLLYFTLLFFLPASCCPHYQLSLPAKVSCRTQKQPKLILNVLSQGCFQLESQHNVIICRQWTIGHCLQKSLVSSGLSSFDTSQLASVTVAEQDQKNKNN